MENIIRRFRTSKIVACADAEPHANLIRNKQLQDTLWRPNGHISGEILNVDTTSIAYGKRKVSSRVPHCQCYPTSLLRTVPALSIINCPASQFVLPDVSLGQYLHFTWWGRHKYFWMLWLVKDIYTGNHRILMNVAVHYLCALLAISAHTSCCI